MKTCRDCGNLEGCITENNKQNCEFNPDFEGEKYCEGFVERKPMTNGDRIRAMTDEEIICACAKVPICPPKTVYDCEFHCTSCWIEYIQQTYKGDAE